jgi:hypothetical protein
MGNGEKRKMIREQGTVFSDQEEDMENASDTHNPLIGAWELISGFYVGENGAVTNYENASLKSLKVLSEGKFAFVTSANGAFYAAGGGGYMIENDIYTEIPSLASEPAMIGQRYVFQFKLEGDTWTNSRRQEGVVVESEVWRRVI